MGEDQEDELVVATDSRVMRGGSFVNQASVVRSAFRASDVPTSRDNIIGFRLARTLPLGTFTALPPTAEGGRSGRPLEWDAVRASRGQRELLVRLGVITEFAACRVRFHRSRPIAFQSTASRNARVDRASIG